MNNEAHRLHRELRSFTTFACLIGIVVPFVILSLIDVFTHFVLGYERVFSVLIYVLFALTALWPFIGCFYTYSSLFESLTAQSNLAKIKKTLYTIGISTTLLMGVIIFLTGGVLRSLFSFYLIYLPSVVGIAFTPSKETKGRGIKYISFFCALVIIVCLFIHMETSQYKDFYGSIAYKIGYIFISIIQLLAIVLIERKSVS